MNNAALLSLTFILAFGFSAQALTFPEPYLDGPATCAANSESRSKEHELWLQVPVDYRNPTAGTTPLYAWTKKPFDPSQPTAVFVAGGPGDASHKSSLELPDWNIVFFDQRGVSCSRPSTRELYLTREFYSSENTARDIDEIRKHLGLSQISVYGVSYGTAPAHLYGHLFPDTARAIVLEGVIFEGGVELMDPARRTKLLQRFFDSLPAPMQERILQLSQDPEVFPSWFSSVGRMMLYLDNSYAAFRQFLENTIWDETSFKIMISSFAVQESVDSNYGFGSVTMGMLGCQELGMNLTGVSFYAVFNGRKLVSDGYNTSQADYCQSLGFKPEELGTPFKASRHPSRATTTYIQGTYDGATVAPNAIRHFKQAVYGTAQLVLVKNGGHAPLIGTLSSGYESGAPVIARERLLSQALEGQSIAPAALADLQAATSMPWLLTVKSAPK